MSAWNALVSDVNKAIADMNSEASKANSAATLAGEAANAATVAAENAEKAADAANEAAEETAGERAKWELATASIRTLTEDEEATLELRDVGGVKNFAFAVPRGKTGVDGAQGPAGVSGVSFMLSGTSLYITKG